MKITFSNLGAIKKTTLDLRPLTVIIGPNNSNKTYIAYSVYGLLKRLGHGSTKAFLDKLGFSYRENELSKDNDKFFEYSDEGIYSLKITDKFIQSYIEDYVAMKNGFEKTLDVFFQDSSEKLFKKTNFEINITKKEIISTLKKFVANTINNSRHLFRFSLDKNVIQIKFDEEFFIEKSEIPSQSAIAIGFETKELLFKNPFLLPAERNALVITYKILETRRYDLLKNADREIVSQSTLSSEDSKFLHRRNIRYPTPIEDFLNFLTNLEIGHKLENEEFSDFASIIEKDLQGNNKTKLISTKIEAKEIKINVKKDLDIDLHNASSSIKQLAPLLLYLRYSAKEGDLLIIDEPEMNLHPESQAKLLEVLGMLVNAGVNVLLTTHSPYFMSHLNNLIAGDMANEKVREKQAKSLYLQDSRAFLKPEDVSAYEMKNNKLVSLKHKDEDGDYSISWETLSDVSADIQRKFFEMYEKREETSKDEEKE